MKKIRSLTLFLLICFSMPTLSVAETVDIRDPELRVYFIDPKLRAAVEKALGIKSAEITVAKMAELTRLEAPGSKISYLFGLEYAINLKVLKLARNRIEDLSPLSGLTNLKVLGLMRNRIKDVSPLVANTGLGDGDTVTLTRNPLDTDAIKTHIPALKQRGVTVKMDPPKQGVVFEKIHPYLATPAAGHIYEIPVVIMRFLPTADGVNLDVSKAADYGSLGPITLKALKAKIDVFDKRVKYMLEEGSRFRGYKNPDARPSIGYRVVKYITVYEQTPPGRVKGYTSGFPVYLPDYHEIFKRFNMKHYIETLGVKEIWIWHGHVTPDFPSYDPSLHKPEDFIDWWESNMSSPLTGDISNSDRNDTDLPVYNSTYTVYGQNFRRTHAEAVHNHGHHLEAILSHVNSNLFWKKFVGKDENGNFITGRAGWTHMPPNTTEHYDSTNKTLVESDIEDWTPDNSGEKKLVNADTWGKIPYSWRREKKRDIPQRVESQWYIYWMQNMPGHENQIQYQNRNLTNWWVFTADWDRAISEQIGLVSQIAPAAPSENAILEAGGPDKTRLLTNYPNPSNPETWIPYQLAEDNEVSIRIYDATGAVVRRLSLGHQRAGFYTGRSRAAYWDGRNAIGESVASGVYFYTITAGEFTATRKMLIRK